jgi:hypothetical protein
MALLWRIGFQPVSASGLPARQVSLLTGKMPVSRVRLEAYPPTNPFLFFAVSRSHELDRTSLPRMDGRELAIDRAGIGKT